MAWVPALASIWDIQGPSPESRRAVESCYPVTIDGPVQLDKEPDVAQILLLSDAFKIDELVALQLVQRGYAQVGRSLLRHDLLSRPPIRNDSLRYEKCARLGKFLRLLEVASCWRMSSALCRPW